MGLTHHVLATTRIASSHDVMPRQSETSPVENADNAGSGSFGHELARDSGDEPRQIESIHHATNLTLIVSVLYAGIRGLYPKFITVSSTSLYEYTLSSDWIVRDKSLVIGG